ncbi:Chitin synthase regulatory factor 4 [Hypsizygus marmoreus]|uniref:Chitin synthase regulatory factor 4 n=1 Tax=Hypsizygus marmoreus TaxID=39966 RepID=A0A369KGW4_HYPMA|nr:Chitin synthase regulatory factor 4 [Hypsizygus marmoreus]
MSAPPVPPRPYSAQGYEQRQNTNPPPVPPLPPDLIVNQYESPPHFDDPLAAPRPHRIDPSIPANMANTLDDHVYNQLPQPSINYNPGFAIPQQQGRGPSPLPPPQGAEWSPWAGGDPYGTAPPPPQRQRTYSTPGQLPPIAASYPTNQDFAFSTPPQPVHPQHLLRTQSTYGPAPKAPSPPAVPSLTAPMPTIASLQAAVSAIQQPNHDLALKIAWARDVFFLVDKQQNSTSTDTPVGPVTITDSALLRLVQIAVPLVLQIASTAVPGAQIPVHVAEAVYLRATFAASGAYPEHVQLNPRSAFRDFETAARGGYAAAWFRLGRDYENFNDVTHARDCFERGVKLGVESCAYRMGMAHLMGQLGLPANPNLALPLLHRAATLATTAVPQPAYVYALLLLGEFTQLSAPLPSSLFAPYIPPSSSPALEARKHLERAAYLGFAPAQYKLGHAYEFAQPPFPFDPLLSVQYYSLASQQGEVEADMALSKWFLCGSGAVEGEEGGFDKDESLAWTFADKAARRGLPSAEFAMGYYAEVGVGGPKDLQAAVRWYTKAKEHGNQDAAERLAALSLPSPNALSRNEHDAITETKLVRKRTQAKQRSDTLGYNHPGPQLPTSPYPAQPYQQQQHQQQPQRQTRPDGHQVVDNIRKNSIAAAGGFPTPHSPAPTPQLTPAQQYQQQFQQSQQQQQQQQQQQGGRQPITSEYQSRPSPAGSRPQSQGPRPQRQQQQQQQYPGTNRYTLTDSPVPTPTGGRKSPGPGVASGRKSPARPGMGRGAGGGRVGAGAGGGGGGGQGQGPVLDIGPSGSGTTTPGAGGGMVIAPKPSKGPTTFAEMGFQGAKAEDKECVVM